MTEHDDTLPEVAGEPTDVEVELPVGDPADATAADLGLDPLALAHTQRDEYLDLARRVQAEYENYRKRVERQLVEQRERAAEDLVRELLPVLDAFEAAIGHGVEGVEPIHAALVAVLEKSGLARLADPGVPFDPNLHDAVMHEPGDGEPTVAEVLRAGYLWNSRVVRPAMVKVQG